MNQADIPIVNPIVVLREEFDDWAVLFNPDTANAVGTNPVGVAVWKMMDGKRDLATIIAGIKDRFEAVPEAVIQDIDSFVSKLADNGFVGLELKRI